MCIIKPTKGNQDALILVVFTSKPARGDAPVECLQQRGADLSEDSYSEMLNRIDIGLSIHIGSAFNELFKRIFLNLVGLLGIPRAFYIVTFFDIN